MCTTNIPDLLAAKELNKDFKDEILCHTCSKIMSIMISFESIMTHLVDIVYTAG